MLFLNFFFLFLWLFILHVLCFYFIVWLIYWFVKNFFRVTCNRTLELSLLFIKCRHFSFLLLSFVYFAHQRNSPGSFISEAYKSYFIIKKKKINLFKYLRCFFYYQVNWEIREMSWALGWMNDWTGTPVA